MNRESGSNPPDASGGNEGEPRGDQTTRSAGRIDHLSDMITELERKAALFPDEKLPRASEDETDPRVLQEELTERKKFLDDMKTCMMLYQEVIRLSRQLIELSYHVSVEAQMEIVDSPLGKAIEHFQDANTELLEWFNSLDESGTDEVESRHVVEIQLTTLRTTERLLRTMIEKAEKHRRDPATE